MQGPVQRRSIRSRPLTALAPTLACVLGVAFMAGCSHMPKVSMPKLRWPFGHHAAPAPEVVHELDAAGEGGAAVEFPQYWDRNTLIVDMRSVSGIGSAVLTPRAGTAWPMRLSFRVTPGSVGELEVRGEQRAVIAVSPAGGTAVDVGLNPAVYGPRTAKISVSWGPAAAPAP